MHNPSSQNNNDTIIYDQVGVFSLVCALDEKSHFFLGLVPAQHFHRASCQTRDLFYRFLHQLNKKYYRSAEFK